jgi:hypothetical protein
MGSTAKWTQMEELLCVVDAWPEHWVLVVHPRYGADSLDEYTLKKIYKNKKIFLSPKPVRYTYDLGVIINSADVGLVLYDIDTLSPYTGKNILFIGLGSGKFSMYLKYGIPVMTSNNTSIADIVSKYQLGYVVQNINAINPKYFDTLNINELRENCRSFFGKYLDFSLYENSLLELIKTVIARHEVAGIITDNNKSIDLCTMEACRLNITYNKMREELNDLKSKLTVYEKIRICRIASKVHKWLKKIYRSYKSKIIRQA